MTIPAITERQALCDLLLELGPDAPTLCDGWSAADLAAHLVIRDRRPDGAIGILVPAAAGYTDRLQQRTRDTRTYEDLVEAVRSGPPRLSPMRVPTLNAAANTGEYFVHHEDLRRAQPDWQARTLSPELADALWAGLRRAARLLLRSLPVGVTLVAPGHGTIRGGKGEPTVTVTGDPGELVLFAFGRRGKSLAGFDGPPDDVAAVQDAQIGL